MKLASTSARLRALKRTVMAWSLPFLWVGPASADGSITLRPIARIEEGRPIRLMDIADIRGDECERFGTLELEPLVFRDGQVSLHEIRDVLDAQHGVNWGRIALSGSDCRVVRIDTPAVPTSDSGTPSSDQPTSETTGVPVVKHLIGPQIAESMGVDPSRLRLTFDDRDESRALLQTETIGRRIEVRPIGRSDTLPISITIYDGPSIVARGIVRARVEVQREIAVARVEISRGAIVTDELIERQMAWLAPSDRSLDPSRLGELSIAQIRIAPGRTLTEQSVQAAFAIEKGDIAVIHCLSGGFVMKMRARALADGRPGETIDFAPLDGRKGRVIRAKVDEPGIAIAQADADLDSPLNEEQTR